MQSLKNGLQFNVSEGSVSSINPIPTDLFWPCNRLQRVGVKLSKSHFFWIGNYYLLTWSLAHLLSNLKTFKKAIKTWIWRKMLYWSHHILTFSTGNLVLSCFCWIESFSYIFSLLFVFLQSFNVISIEKFIMGIFYFILVWRGLKSIAFF